jgi:glycerol kinase
MINSLESNEGVYLVPAFVGLGIPYWDTDARAAVVGMSRGTGKEHVVRAAVESMAYQIKDAVDLMKLESGINPRELRVDGGPTRNKFLMQFQADMTDINVVCTNIVELSSMGSVYLAGLGAGIWKDRNEVRMLRKEANIYMPKMNEKARNKYYEGWKSAVKRVLTR